jgi:putative ABC transport system permease protein
MFRNYLTMALRSLLKNKLYAAINVLGLAIGLALYIFAVIGARYESTHDQFFANSGSIYSSYVTFSPTAGVGVSSNSGTFSAVPPILKAEMPELLVARSFREQYLTRIDDDKYFEDIHFVDPEFIDIFQFDYISGDGHKAINDPNGLILTESVAEKFFGEADPMGQTLIVNQSEAMVVRAIIRDLPDNSHFTTSIIAEAKLSIIAPVAAYARIEDYDLTGNWNNLGFGETNYILLPEGMTQAELDQALAGIYERHTPEDSKELVSGMESRRLDQMNTMIWDMIGLPVLESIQILGFLILIVACLNYTNLATAQALGRMREVGIRKTMGATKGQLFRQFLTESTIVAMISLVMALVALELIIPVANNAMGKHFSLGALMDVDLTLRMVGIVLFVGLLAGGYPAYVITKVQAADILRGTHTKGRKGVLLRNFMLVTQFTISIFLIASAVIMYQQNNQMEVASEIFSKDRVIDISRIDNENIAPLQDIIKTEIGQLQGVERVAYARQGPFEQSQGRTDASLTGDFESDAVQLWFMQGDEDFMSVFDTEIVAGRNFDLNMANDTVLRDEDGNRLQEEVNVILNDMAVTQLGFSSPEEALGQVFYIKRQDVRTANRIIGVVPTVNYMGLHNELKPYMFHIDRRGYGVLLVRIAAGDIPATLERIDAAWNRVVPDFPIARSFIDEDFDDVYSIFAGINVVLAAFAAIAMILAAIGLFGMAAYMAERRTKEIGIRKVMGASIGQIIRLLVWQFSRPVVISLVLGLPLAAAAAGLYLDFFADRIALTPTLFIATAVGALTIAWLTVGGHAFRVAHTNPVGALRYE